ncbi:MAG TPA: hypothetical protein VIH61_04940, partial [Waddliaceae bacterium]
KQRVTIDRWTEKNQGKVSLFAVASGKRNNQPLLDLLTAFNRGSLYYGMQDQELEALLRQLIVGIRNPIGKEIHVTLVQSKKGNSVTLFPAQQFLPNLYEEIPFIVYGVADRLEEFHLFFQGRYYDKYFDIKKKVSFLSAARGDSQELERAVALLKAYEYYYQFLKEGKTTYLFQAKQLLIPYNIPIAFQ